MSLKAVELQIALPKTFEAGKIVEQHQQNTINQQLHANERLKRENERKQLTVNDSEGIESLKDEDQRNQQDPQTMQQKDKERKERESTPQHPFKGNFIDFSG